MVQEQLQGAAELARALRSSIEDASARIGVVGLGYVGLPLALAFSRVGFKVAGVDTSEPRIEMLTGGRSPISDVADDEIEDQVAAGRLVPSLSYDTLRDCDAIFICVPTPFDRSKVPDLSFIRNAATGVARVLRPGHLVLLESTTFPGTTEEILVPILEQSGLRAGRDFFVAFSPERIDPGNKTYGIRNTPKVVGGIDATSTELAAVLLGEIVGPQLVHRVSTTRVAEMTKLLENTFRAVNIALVNELAMLCDRMNIDIWEVVAAARTKPYGFMSFQPGPGVGGHCIPVDPYYLSWKAREFDFSTKFVDLAAETNQQMPFFTVEKLRRAFASQSQSKTLRGARVLVLGVAFKPNVEDCRHSAAIRVIEILRASGAIVEYHDPHVQAIEVASDLYRASATETLRSVEIDDDRLKRADCVAILVGHERVDYPRVLSKASLVFDAVNATSRLVGEYNNRVRL